MYLIKIKAIHLYMPGVDIIYPCITVTLTSASFLVEPLADTDNVPRCSELQIASVVLHIVGSNNISMKRWSAFEVPHKSFDFVQCSCVKTVNCLHFNFNLCRTFRKEE